MHILLFGYVGRKSVKRIPAFDGIRAMAVFSVMFFHINSQRYIGGYIGVDIFFVLSGYLITSILILEFSNTGTISIKKFYLRRIIRLTPALWLMLAICGVYAAIALKDSPEKAIAYSALYTMNWIRAFGGWPFPWFQHTWSLAIEEQFYLVWAPLLLFFLSRIPITQLRLVLILALISGVIWRCFFIFWGASVERTYNGFDTHADGLLVGAILATLKTHKINLALSVFSLGLLSAAIYALPYDGSIYLTVGLPIISIATAIIIATIIGNERGLVASVFGAQPLVFLGRISYGIYLWHFPILFILKNAGYSGRILSALVPILTVCIAIISFYFIEAPILKLRPNEIRKGG